jgi:hypothetical protein
MKTYETGDSGVVVSGHDWELVGERGRERKDGRLDQRGMRRGL